MVGALTHCYVGEFLYAQLLIQSVLHVGHVLYGQVKKHEHQFQPLISRVVQIGQAGFEVIKGNTKKNKV